MPSPEEAKPPQDLSPMEKELLGDALNGAHVRWSVIRAIVLHNGDLRHWLETLVRLSTNDK